MRKAELLLDRSSKSTKEQRRNTRKTSGMAWDSQERGIKTRNYFSLFSTDSELVKGRKWNLHILVSPQNTTCSVGVQHMLVGRNKYRDCIKLSFPYISLM